MILPAVVLAPLPAADDSGVDEAKTAADRWIDLEARTAHEREEWRLQKEVLTTSIDVLKKEQEALQAKVEANDLAAGLLQGTADKLQADLAAHDAAHAALASGGAALETRLRALFVRLPGPLQEKIRPLLERINRPNADPPVSASERTQAVVTILTAIDQFNNALTLTHHLRPVEGGGMVDVKVLYWGLAMAYGIDAAGQHAWTLRPGAEGWQWTDATDRAGEIKTLIAIYEKDAKPQLVVLPAGRGAPSP